MNDALIGTIAAIFDLFAAIAFLLVSQSWQLYLGKLTYNFNYLNTFKIEKYYYTYTQYEYNI